LEWTEAVTLLGNGHVPDGVYEKVRVHFSEHEFATLTLAVAMINTWNRLNVAFRTQAGGYRPGMFKGLAE
jgi:alkylhydroperoxidase family enzyme